MRKEEADPDTRLAGTQALYNALAFVKKNFDNETERNYIMQTVCETTQAERSDIRNAAYECVVSTYPNPNPNPIPNPTPTPTPTPSPSPSPRPNQVRREHCGDLLRPARAVHASALLPHPAGHG